MNIRWLGHSSFAFTQNDGSVIVTDPFNDYVGFSMPKISAEFVTISHGHSDHNYVSAVVGNPTVFDTQGDFVANDCKIHSFKTFHDPQNGRLRGENLIFTYCIDGIKVCHMGDIGEDCNNQIVNQIGDVDILLIPVGGTYTVDALGAKKYVDSIKPKVVIPMHYATNDCKFDISTVVPFIKLFKQQSVTYVNSNNIEFDRSQFSGDKATSVIVLNK